MEYSRLGTTGSKVSRIAIDLAQKSLIHAKSQAQGGTIVPVSLAWAAQGPGVTAPIIVATKLDYIDEANSALEPILTTKETASMQAAYQPIPFQGHA